MTVVFVTSPFAHNRCSKEGRRVTTSRFGSKKTQAKKDCTSRCKCCFCNERSLLTSWWQSFPTYRCMAFFRDAHDEHYVAVRWYEEMTPPKGSVLELPSLKLAPDNLTRSYSILPESTIVNGAVLIKCRGTYWAVQSPREEFAYNRNNLWFQM